MIGEQLAIDNFWLELTKAEDLFVEFVSGHADDQKTVRSYVETILGSEDPETVKNFTDKINRMISYSGNTPMRMEKITQAIINQSGPDSLTGLRMKGVQI